MRQQHDAFVRAGTEILVLGPDSPEEFRQHWERERLPFIGLPDPDHAVLQQYGQEVRILRLGRLPAQILVDREGMVRHAHYSSSMADIPVPEEILGAAPGSSHERG